MESGNFDDGSRMVALPWDLGPTLYYYRTDVFEEVGLPDRSG